MGGIKPGTPVRVYDTAGRMRLTTTAVYFEQTPLGVNWGYGMISLWSRADYHISNGQSVEEVRNAGWFGSLTDGIITFPTGGILISMAE